jgi:hypothetical protein
MQQRRGTAAQWISTNQGNGPILAPGEIGFESDNNRFKMGDGINHWVDLPYFSDNEALTNLIGNAPELLNTLGELADALGDDPAFITTVATNLSNHQSDTTNIHGIADTSLLATKSYADTAEADAITAAGTAADTKISSAVAALTKSSVGLGNVDNTSDANKPVSTAAQTALDLKAPKADPTFTGTVSGVTKAHVGLGNVDNTADADKPVSTAQASAIATAKSEAIADATSQVNAVIASAPAALNTLDELAAALGDDANYAATITTALGTKAPLESPTFTGTVSGVTATHVGLGNVDNTSDADKPVSTATQTALDAKASDTDLSDHTSATTNVHGILDTDELATKDYVTQEIGNSEVDQAALAGEGITWNGGTQQFDIDSTVATKTFAAGLLTGATKSNITITGDENGLTISAENGVADSTTDNLTEGSTNKYFTDERAQDAVGNAVGNGLKYTDSTGAIEPDLANFGGLYIEPGNKLAVDGYYVTFNAAEQTLTNKTLTSPVINTPTGITKSDVGLGSVDNTSDSDKPVSTATQTALDAKLALAGGTMTGAITLHADPSSALHATTKQYVDNTASGIVAKPQVLGATTANIDATYNNGTAGVGSTLTHNTNGVFPAEAGGASGWAVGKGILVKNQNNKEENGRYYVSDMGSVSTPYVLTRCSYCDEASEIPGAYIFVQDGTLAGTGWIQVVADPATFTVGTDDIDVYQFSGSGTITAGTGITVNGNQVSIDAAVTATLDDPTFTGTVDFTGATLTGIPVTEAATPSTLGTVYAITDEVNTNGNTAIGSGALALNDGGTNNTAIGASALSSNEYSDSNTAIGFNAGASLLSGSNNTLVGFEAEASDTEAYNEITLGNGDVERLRVPGLGVNLNQDSITIGAYSSPNATDYASQNVIIGASSAGSLTTGASNLIVGYSAGYSETTGEWNTFLGTEAGSNATTGNNNIAIGKESELSSATVSNEITLGNSDITRFRIPGLGIDTRGGSTTVSSNTATTVSTVALEDFTTMEYTVSIKQGSKIRSSKVLVQTDGTTVDSVEHSILETGGTIAGVNVTAAVSSTDAILTVTITDASSTNATVKVINTII